MQSPSFPPHFLWGAATASYQIEGAVSEGGRGESIWDRFCATPGKVRNGESGAVADDFYHRYRDDIALMRQLGLDAFRFSIAWPRILPTGRGRANEEGLDFYDRLVDELLAGGIEPFATLYHWDLPQPLEDVGGWTNRDTCQAFVEYVEMVVRRLGDRVHNWITHNEPWVAAMLGYGGGEHAPGRAEGTAGALRAAHHMLLSHGLAIPVIRSESPDAQVGITLNLTPFYPGSDSPQDAEATRISDGRTNRWFLDPLFRGAYPADIVAMLGDDMPPIQDGDLAIISQPIDFLGVNNYSREVVRTDPDTGQRIHGRLPDAAYTDMGWEVYPEGLHDLLVRLHREYAPTRLYVTENGAAFPDVPGHDGAVNDPERQSFLASYLEAAGRAIQQGVPLAGYFVWSFLDNFEWAFGYSKRFGIVYVDYPTLQRIPKGSFHWYREFIARQHTSRQALD